MTIWRNIVLTVLAFAVSILSVSYVWSTLDARIDREAAIDGIRAACELAMDGWEVDEVEVALEQATLAAARNPNWLFFMDAIVRVGETLYMAEYNPEDLDQYLAQSTLISLKGAELTLSSTCSGVHGKK